MNLYKFTYFHWDRNVVYGDFYRQCFFVGRVAYSILQFPDEVISIRRYFLFAVFFLLFFFFFFGAEDPALIFCWQWFPGINLCAFGVFIYFPCINTRVFVCVCVYVMAFDLFPLRLIVAKMVKLPCKCTSTDTQQIRIDSIHGIYRLHCNWWGPMWFFRSGFLRDDIVDWTAVFTFFATVFVGTNFGFIIVLAPRPCCPQVIDCGDNNSVGAIV